ncbi:MAG TPA: outer membrane beta-barrel protein [Vicinamibacteria bacterium]|nr:outer membrane beta-barrel protein [Vicinamibacteria bacterium]
MTRQCCFRMIGVSGLVAVILLLWVRPALSQPVDLMQRERDRALDRRFWRLGPFYLTPAMRAGFGYDSNAFLAGDETHPDIQALFGPGLTGVVPFGERAMVELYEELDFVYYRDFEQLRDVFNVTRVGGAFGGKNLIFKVRDEFRDEKVQPSREFDVPVDQRSNRLIGTLDVALGWRQELLFSYERYRVEIADNELTLRGTPLKSLMDRLEERYGVELVRNLTPDTSAFGEAFYASQTYVDPTVARDANGYGVGGGFRFSPTGNVRGEARLALKRLTPISPEQVGFDGFIGSADVRVGLGRRLSLEGLYFRDASPSVLRKNLFVVTSYYGAYLDVYLGPRFSLRPGFRLGKNDYPGTDSGAPSTPTPADIIRSFRLVSATFDYRLTPELRIRTGMTYSTRETSSPSAPRERFLVNLGLTTEF